MILPSGRSAWHHGKIFKERDENGKTVRLLGTVQDITDRKVLEQTLEIERKRLSMLLEAFPGFIYLQARDYSVRFANQYFVDQFGNPQNKPCYKVLWKRKTPCEKCHTFRVFDTGSHQIWEWAETPNGKTYMVHDYPFIDVDGTELVLEIGIDITEWKKAEKSLRESEVKYRSMMESFVDPLYIGSLDLDIQYLNPAMLKRIGRDATGEKCYKALHGQPKQCEWCPSEMSVGGGKTEITVRSPLDERHYRITSMPIENPDGTTSRMGVFRDVTDYLQAVSDKERAQAQLLQAQKMEAIGTLAGGIAHDFNNVLGIILGNLELAAFDIPEWSPASNSLGKVRKACFRARDMVQQILAFSRQAEKDMKPLRLGHLVLESVKMLRATIPTTIDIREESSTNEDFVLADPTRLNQVLVNLCTNAAHAMREKGGALSISLTNRDVPDETETIPPGLSPGPYVVLTVSDTGHGMSPEIMERIFEPYYTTKEPGEGTGMGMAMVDGIVRDHGGAVLVRSSPGKGSVFEVFLPMYDAEPEPEEEEPQPLPLGTEKILFIDDEEGLAEIGSKMLEQLHYEVTKQTNCLEALALFQQAPDRFDLVITDMTMPHMTGADLALEFMRLRPDVPIILCTGFSEMISREKAEKMGIRAFVTKPLGLRLLAETVRNILDQETK